MNKQEFLSKLDLNWAVEKQPIFLENQQEIEGNIALVRTDTGHVLNVASNKYKPIQNEVFWDVMQPLLESGSISNPTGGHFSSQKTFAQASLDLKAEVVSGDEISGKFTLLNSHDGSIAFRAGLTPVRIYCQNTLMSVQNSMMGISIRHSATSADKLMMLNESIKIAAKSFDDSIEFYKHLASRTISVEELEIFIKTCLNLKTQDDGELSTNASNKLAKVIDFFESGNGANKASGTLWNAYNAVTEYTTHELGQESSLFGQGNAINERAIQLLKAA
jgi:phage/plasmid-like protein (TIGR03299 family)